MSSLVSGHSLTGWRKRLIRKGRSSPRSAHRFDESLGTELRFLLAGDLLTHEEPLHPSKSTSGSLPCLGL